MPDIFCFTYNTWFSFQWITPKSFNEVKRRFSFAFLSFFLLMTEQFQSEPENLDGSDCWRLFCMITDIDTMQPELIVQTVKHQGGWSVLDFFFIKCKVAQLQVTICHSCLSKGWLECFCEGDQHHPCWITSQSLFKLTLMLHQVETCFF